MAHHKRGRSKNQRSGCLMCKWYKGTDSKDTASARMPQEVRADDREASFFDDLLDESDDDAV